MISKKYFYFSIVTIMISAMLGLSGCTTVNVSKHYSYHPVVPKAKADRERLTNIRVLLFKNAKKLKLSSMGPVKLYNMQTRQKMLEMNCFKPVTVKASRSGLNINNRIFQANPVRIVPRKNESLTLNGKTYHGQIEFTITAKGTVTAINYLPLEDYLQGVVPNEVVASWPMEALKAQAVTARTFALYKMSGRKNKAYDLDASVNSQVYRGKGSEQDRTTRAVKQTKGQVVVYKGTFIAAFYHSNCGGHTANVKNVWGSLMDYLKGSPCGFCESGPHYKWSYTTTLAKLQKQLRKLNRPVGKLVRLRLHGRDSSNRVKTISLEGSKDRQTIKAAAFRMMIGADKIKSTNFYRTIHGDQQSFVGKGWGHGVGLCQEGACGMAQSGYNYKDIIRHYYPGSKLSRIVP